MGWVYRILLRLAGALVARYLMPLFSPEVRTALETVLPIADRYVVQLIPDRKSGTKKRDLASGLIWEELNRAGKADGVVQADVDQAIQLAYYRLGLDKPKRGAA
jgi:hypothetical protein